MRVLVVEDEVRLAARAAAGAAGRGLRRRPRRTTAPTGLDLARHGGYDAMVLDVMLPGCPATGSCGRCGPSGNWVPVLMLSAKDGEYDQADGLDCGADDYLTKPFSYVVLLARLRALLRRGAPRAAGGAHRRRPGARPGPAPGHPRRRRRSR